MTSAADLALVAAFHREAADGGLAIVRPAAHWTGVHPLQLGDTDANDVAAELSRFIAEQAAELEECRTALTLVAASIPCTEAHVVPKVRELVGRSRAYESAVANLESVLEFAAGHLYRRVRGVLDVLSASLAREARS